MNESNTPDQVWSRTNYFKDGKRKIDFVLVSNLEKSRSEMDMLTMFVENLVNQGVHYEVARGEDNKGLIYIKLHLPEKHLIHFANVYNIFLECNSVRDQIKFNHFKEDLFNTILTKPNPKDPLYRRAPHSISGSRPTEITSAERTLILSKLLARATFTRHDHDRGPAKLIKSGVLVAAFPLHDSDFKWPEHGFISDRQLLEKYWANPQCWYKNQPINLINKYFGTEVAIYFAFVDFYIKMLVPASVIGTLFLIFSFLMRFTLDTQRVDDICDSDFIMCPACLRQSYCSFKSLEAFCAYSGLIAMVDNITGFLFVIFITFWSTIFIELWKRREAELIFNWNLINVESDTETRLEYYARTKYRRISKYTGKLEPYMPLWVRCLNYTVTVIFCSLMILIVLLAILGSMVIRLIVSRGLLATGNYTLIRNTTLISMCLGALISCVFIKICSPWYMKGAIWLTERENPRTSVEYYNSCIYKSYMLSFVNIYFPIFYLAFVKGHIFSYPGDESQYELLPSLFTDTCHPSGCLFAMTIMLLFILILKQSMGRIFVSIVRSIRRSKRRKAIEKVKDLPAWEADLKLLKCGKFLMMKDYAEVAIQYGFVTFFVSALPIAPLLGLINSIVELRCDAAKFIKSYRRPVPVRLPGIGAWNVIFKVITYLGTITNAFVLVFTSDLLSRELYRINNGNLDGYVNTTLSEFKTTDYSVNVTNLMKNTGYVDVCYYRGTRYPPDHEEKYKLTSEYWKVISLKFACVVFFEQFIWFLKAICATVIPDNPDFIVQDVYDEKVKLKEMRYTIVKESLDRTNLTWKQNFTI